MEKISSFDVPLALDYNRVRQNFIKTFLGKKPAGSVRLCDRGPQCCGQGSLRA